MESPTFDDFETFGEADLENAMRSARAFVENLVARPWGGGYCLSLLGRSGNGKTLLARCVWSVLKIDAWGCAEVVKPVIRDNRLTRFDCAFRDWRKISDRMKAGEWGIIDALEEYQFLVLDDVGADHDPNSIAAGKLDRLLRARTGKWTIVTSNFLLAGIAQNMDQRIASYLIRDLNKPVEMNVKDYWLRGQGLSAKNA